MATVGARPSRSTRARPSDDELLDTALAVFAEHGFTATTMSVLAERCDSTKPTLYAHFGDKEAMFARLLEREADTCRGFLFPAYAAGAERDLAAQVETATRALFDYAGEHPDGFRLLLGADLTVAAVRVREQLLDDVRRRLGTTIDVYLRRRDLSERVSSDAVVQLAAILAGVALSSAQHSLSRGLPLDSACAMAVTFSTAALTQLDPSSASAETRTDRS